MNTFVRHALIVVMVLAGFAGTVSAQVITPQVSTERLRVLQQELERRNAEIRLLELEAAGSTEEVNRSRADARLRLFLRGLDPAVRAERLNNAKADQERRRTVLSGRWSDDSGA